MHNLQLSLSALAHEHTNKPSNLKWYQKYYCYKLLSASFCRSIQNSWHDFIGLQKVQLERRGFLSTIFFSVWLNLYADCRKRLLCLCFGVFRSAAHILSVRCVLLLVNPHPLNSWNQISLVSLPLPTPHPSPSCTCFSFFSGPCTTQSLAWLLFFTIETDITDQHSQAWAQQTETK